MNLDSIRAFCISFPRTKEDIPWENTLTFKVEGKMFAIVNLNAPHYFAIKCPPENFDERIEAEHIKPAPYLAKAKWISIRLEKHSSWNELKEWIRESYLLIIRKLPKKKQEKILKVINRSS